MKIVIIGNGVAGITCALAARQRDAGASITVVSGETDYFFSRTALMYAYMNTLQRRDLEPLERGVYAKQRIERVRDWVVDMHHSQRTLTLGSGQKLTYDKLVFAVGAVANMFPWAGAAEVKDGLVHFVSMQDLDTCERLTPSTREAVVVGGGLIGIELVECLLYHRKKVTFLVREPWYWPVALGQEESEMVGAHMRAHGVELALNEELSRIDVDPQGRVKSVHTSAGRDLPCQLLGVCAGVHPAVERLKKFTEGPRLGRGIVVDPTLQTDLDGVYACGDCAEIHTPGQERPLTELIWYSAKRQGALVARNLFGDEVTYQPPIFFNSSKFFEIEYTTVGQVMELPEGTPTIYRRLPGKNVSQRIVHDGTRVLGFNMLGSRWNHEVLERWVQERRSPDFCLKHLPEAQYDVEFGRAALSAMREETLPLHKETRR